MSVKLDSCVKTKDFANLVDENTLTLTCRPVVNQYADKKKRMPCLSNALL